MMPEDKFSFVLKSLLAGGVAGMCSKTAVAPLDRVKILLQAQNTQYSNMGVAASLGHIVKTEGVMALFKGNGAQMLRIFPFGAIQFSSYEGLRWLLGDISGGRDPHVLKFVAGALGGVCAVSATFPLDTVRARLAFQVQGETKYRGIYQTAKAVKQEGGIIGLYRGLTPNLIGIIPNAGLSFYCFEMLKLLVLENFPFFRVTEGEGEFSLSVAAKLLCGGFAGAAAQTVSYPLDVARRRMQLGQFSTGTVGVIANTYRTNGVVRGLYRGMSVNFLRAVPMTAVSFSVYETMKQRLGLETAIKISVG